MECITIAELRADAEYLHETGDHLFALSCHRCATDFQHSQREDTKPRKLTHDTLCFCVDCMSRASTNNGRGRL